LQFVFQQMIEGVLVLVLQVCWLIFIFALCFSVTAFSKQGSKSNVNPGHKWISSSWSSWRC